jgi:hypothetical protein
LPRLAAPQAALQACLCGIGVGGEATPGARLGGAAEGGLMVASAAQIHHCIPRRLLKVWDGGHGSSLEPEDLAAWIKWEEEAYRYGVDPDVSREVLATLIKGSTVELGVEEHRAAHSEAGDFARWGRLGGLKTFGLYGPGWFVLLARRRWQKISAVQLEAAFAAINAGRS